MCRRGAAGGPPHSRSPCGGWLAVIKITSSALLALPLRGPGGAARPRRVWHWSWRFGAAHREQGKAEVADLGQEAVQGGLVGDRPGEDGPAAVAGQLQAVEPG